MDDSVTHSKSYSSDLIAVTTTKMIMKRHFLKNIHPRRGKLTTKLMWKHLGYGVTSRKMEEKKEFAFC